jgi:hypothetical protein
MDFAAMGRCVSRVELWQVSDGVPEGIPAGILEGYSPGHISVNVQRPASINDVLHPYHPYSCGKILASGH